MGRAPSGGATAFRFNAREVSEMEKALENSKGTTPAREVVLSLADNFTKSAERAGQKPIQWKQVWNWFQNRRHSQKAKIARSPDKPKAVTPTQDTFLPKKVPAASTAVPSGPVRSRNDSQQMEFEAKSARDGAWYDVSTFISHRLTPSGDPEVRVRFAGFGSEEDEWVNVRSAVRQRSLPCEASECVAVLPGDLILCFQEGNEQALYFDADILDVQRRRHDVRGCRCRFWVRYRHDQSEEVVPLRKVCRRPETEYRLLKLQSYGKNPLPAADPSQGVAKSNPPTSVSAGGDAATLVVTKASEVSLQAEAPATNSTVVATPPVAVSAMEVEANPVQSATVPTSTGTAPEQSASVPQRVDTTSVTTEVVGALERVERVVPGVPVGTTSEPAKQPALNEAPSLHAAPEMFNSDSESIVVLDRSDLAGIKKS
ncbi:unnamed protein product [Calypogeia fissa]